MERIDARDVLDPNAKTARAFRARTEGRFRRAGPNAWDDYLIEPVEGGEVIDVLPDVPVQVEPTGARFRLRKSGTVFRLAWLPEAGDLEAGASAAEFHARFLALCCRPFAEAAGIGAAAGIAHALTSPGPKTSLD